MKKFLLAAGALLATQNASAHILDGTTKIGKLEISNQKVGIAAAFAGVAYAYNYNKGPKKVAVETFKMLATNEVHALLMDGKLTPAKFNRFVESAAPKAKLARKTLNDWAKAIVKIYVVSTSVDYAVDSLNNANIENAKPQVDANVSDVVAEAIAETEVAAEPSTEVTAEADSSSTEVAPEVIEPAAAA